MAARTLGISLKEFEGWTPQVTTTIERGFFGRVKSTVTTTESPWDDEQQDWMLALSHWEADRCPGCGGKWSETINPANEDAYMVDAAIRCHSCTAVAEAREKSTNPHPEALFHIPSFHPPREVT